LLLVCMLVALLGSQPAAAEGFLCPDPEVGGWTGPSASNSIPDCLDKGNYGVNGVVAVPIFFPAFIGALVVLLYPLTMCCRYTCNGCGSNRRRPGSLCCGDSQWDHVRVEKKEAQYTVEEVRRLKICALVGFTLTFVGLALTVVGHNDFTAFYDDFDSNLENDIQPYYTVLSTDVQSGLRNVTSGGFLAPVTVNSMAAFSTQVSSINNIIRDIKDYAEIFRATIYNGANVMAIGVILLFGLITIYAALDVRSLFPALTSCFAFLLVLVLGIFACGLFFGHAVLTNGCEEADQQTARTPGVFQWQLVPECRSNSNFGPLISDINTVEVDFSRLACESLFALCNSSSSSNSTYYCPNAAAFPSASSCVSHANVTTVMTNMYARNQGTACTYPTTSSATTAPPTTTGANNCTIAKCKDYCTSTTDASNATRIVQYIAILLRVSTARTRVVELSDCNAQYDRVIKSVSKCTRGRKGMALIGAGATFNAYLSAWAIYILLRGQKRFFKHGAQSQKKYKIRRRTRRNANGESVTVADGSTYVPGDTSTYDTSTRNPY